VLEALEFERERQAVLVEQLGLTLAEADGAGLDEAIFAGMEPEQVEIVRGVLHGPSEDEVDEEILIESEIFGSDPDDDGSVEEEIARLEQALADCRARQQAFERYLAGLVSESAESPGRPGSSPDPAIGS
jgi:hypothetical protein